MERALPSDVENYLIKGRAAVRASGTEPVHIDKGEDAFLVLHGWCATAESVRFLTAGIVAEGFSVLAPTLPGHGTSPDDMQRFGPLDWIAAGREALELLARHHRRVTLLGTSMGGTLALQLAALMPEVVSGLVTVNAPLFLANPDFAVAVMSGRATDALPGWERTEFMGPPVPEFTYSKRSRKSGADLLAMAALAREALPRVVAPLLVLHSIKDQVVPISSAEEIVARAGSASKSLVLLTHSLHAAQLDQDRDRIVELAVTFTRA